MKILVTGAAGFIGSHLVRRLAAAHEVFAMVRQSPENAPQESSAEIVAMDLSRPLQVERLPQSVDVIIHLAQANVDFPERAEELFAVNTAAVLGLLEYGRRARAQRFILASSGDVYGGPAHLAKETDPAQPKTFYATTKHLAEQLALSYSGYIRTIVFRIFTPYGPDQKNRLIPRLAGRIRRRLPVRLNRGDRPIVTPIYVDDVVAAFQRAVTGPSSGVINLAGDSAVSIRELAREISQKLGVEPAFEDTGEECGNLAGENHSMKQAFGRWTMIQLGEGLERTIDRLED